MKKIINKKFYFLLTSLAIALLFCFSGFGINFSSAATLSIANLNTTAFDRADNLLMPSLTGNYLDGNYKQFSWNNLKKLNLRFENYSEVPNSENYNYSLNVDYCPIYITDNNFLSSDSHITLENVYSGTVDNLSKIGNLEYFIDSHPDDADLSIKDIKENRVTKTHKEYGFGWGIYRFTLRVNNDDCKSDYIYVAPTVPSATPIVEYSIVSSQTGLQNAYEFKIVNENSDYTYSDSNLIVWYAKGEGVDGVKYVLTSGDIGLKIGEDYPFNDYGTALWTGDVDRNGTTFYFDSNGKAGTWDVFCVIYDLNHSQVRYQSTAISVTTGTKIEASVIIWIIAGCAVALLAIIIAVIVINKKKEKVW